MTDLVNEFGEEISEDQISELAERIMELAEEDIDELWFKCGLTIKGHEDDGFKALRKRDIKKIKKSIDDAEDLVIDLLTETKLKIVEENLEDLE